MLHCNLKYAKDISFLTAKKKKYKKCGKKRKLINTDIERLKAT